MIDTHCHILPAVDDGSDSMPTSMMMAAMAADSGVRAIIATPHITWDENGGKTILHLREAFCAFSAELGKSKMPIVPVFGAEVLLPREAKTVNTEGFPRIADTDYALVEFFFDDTAEHMLALLSALIAAGIRPIVAHPERYGAVQKNKALARSFTALGAYLQVNKASFFGGFGKKAKAAALRIMSDGIASLVGSDAHDTVYRTTEMHRISAFLLDHYGEKVQKCLTESNPCLLLQNQPMETITI